jgi:hexosaminidase
MKLSSYSKFCAGVLGALLAALAPCSAGIGIIPLPQQVQARPGTFTLCPSQAAPNATALAARRIVVDPASFETGQYLAALLARSTGNQFAVVTNGAAGPIRGALQLTTVNAASDLGTEGYELTVAPDSVVVRAPAQAGVFYGVQSFLQLLPPQIMSPQPVSNAAWTAPCVYIKDRPRFSWRGAMLDVSRHFFDKQEIERVLDAMAMHKLNVLHWHLVDDQGWRIQILSYPLLTQTGAWRNSMNYGQNPRASGAYNAAGKYGGYYTQDDIREVVAYAGQRHILVVPEIELPAHCTAGLASYPQFGCGNPGSSYNMDSINYSISLYSLAGPGCWTFFTNILSEVMGLFPSPYIHCGGDEVVATGDSQWKTYSYDKAQMQALGINPSQSGSPPIIAYQHWFSTNLAAFLKANGRTMIGWSEFEAGGIVTNAVLMDWQTGGNSYAVAAASAGQDVVMSPENTCYVNFCQTTNLSYEPRFIVGGSPSYLSVKTLYNFEPMPASLPAQYTNHILGAQCNLWTEYVPSPLNLEFKLFPRMGALSEITWTAAALKNYSDFTNRLTTLQQRLDQMGINYNREFLPQVGSWTGPMSTSPTTVTYDITPYVTRNGEIDITFYYTTGNNGLNIYSVALLENGAQVDINTYTGFAGLGYTALPYYVLRLPWFHPGSTYTIRASVAGVGGTDSNGKVFFSNWN